MLSKLTKTSNKHHQRNQDRRFRQTERAIIRALLLSPDISSVKILAQKVKISRSTFYRHHKSLRRILPDIEAYTTADFTQQISTTQSTNSTLIRVLFYKLLSFIYKNRQEFQLLVQYGNEQSLDKIMDNLLPKIIKIYHIPAKNNETTLIYQKQIAAVIEAWIKSGFQANQSEVLNDIMYLTRTARQYLIPLQH